MILILSENIDQSTNDVIDWLDHYSQPFKRINTDELEYNEISISPNGTKILHRNKVVKFEDSLVWYRRGTLAYHREIEIKTNRIIGQKINEHLESEYQTITDIICDRIPPANLLGPLNFKINKLRVLEIAEKCGIKIPATIVTNNKKTLLDFYDLHAGEIISKGIQSNPSGVAEGVSWDSYTERLEKTILDTFPEFFFPSLFQQNIVKKLDIRVFYLKERLYAMGIFSQNDETTKIDFRHYNTGNPNRNVPINLPPPIERCLIEIMKKLGLETGSIDLILSSSNEYYFLEVNPFGQFMMVSQPCNFYLEKKIALELIKMK